ncbi:hypothetical protein FGO68_gene7225 [Halteria grandinella]|uniref:Uncharacterized protein n=1 Tax=Halteria grandinella TaxID=5974 RepID=A0A8J8NVS6_HALGN|nr:hypothetical protein FGO68_gene7225 [Halteria grandinella]
MKRNYKGLEMGCQSTVLEGRTGGAGCLALGLSQDLQQVYSLEEQMALQLFDQSTTLLSPIEQFANSAPPIYPFNMIIPYLVTMQKVPMCYYLNEHIPPIHLKTPSYLMRQLLKRGYVLHKLRRDYLVADLSMLALLIAVAEAPTVYAEVLGIGA